MANKHNVSMVDATEVKNRFGEMIKRAYLQEEHLIVRRAGIPVVAIIPVQDYERLIAEGDLPESIAQEIESSSRAAAARDRLRQFLADTHKNRPIVPDDEVEADIAAAIKAVRRQYEDRS
jgi:prevent-host-death family protein